MWIYWSILSVSVVVEATMILTMTTVAPNFGLKRGGYFEAEALKPVVMEANTLANWNQDGHGYSSLICSCGGYGNSGDVKSLESLRVKGEQQTCDFSWTW